MMNLRYRKNFSCFLSGAALCFMAAQALAFENAKVLPKGVRKLSLRNVDTNLVDKTGPDGERASIAAPLAKDLTFKQVVDGYSGIEKTQVQAFLQKNNFAETDSAGHFTADFRGHVHVTAPIFAYGLTDRWTLGMAVPYYQAQTSTKVGFAPNDNARAFVAALADPYTNQVARAREAAGKFSHAENLLNDKLRDNGYSEIEDWSKSGIGDVTVLGKYAAANESFLRSTFAVGFVAPTGRVDDPDVLTDIPFGTGAWAGTLGADLDEPFFNGTWFVNQHVQYRREFMAHRDIRMITSDEPIAVPKESVLYRLGDRVDTGVSLNYEPEFGLTADVGLNASRKFADRYFLGDEQGETQELLEKDTSQSYQEGELGLGYSSVPAFRRGESKVPFDASLDYKKQLRSTNMPVQDLAQFEMTVYF